MNYQKIFLYDEREDVSLTTFVINHSAEFLGEVRRPSVLIVPGGAYLQCSEAEGEPLAAFFNAIGYHAFVLRYSVYMKEEPGIPPVGKPIELREHCLFPRPMEDMAAAIRLIIEHQEEWRVDPSQIILCGFSAGAHNCGMYSVYWKLNEYPKPAAVILGYCLADYKLQFRLADEAEKMMTQMCSMAICGKTEMDEEAMKTLSVIENVNADTPPMFLWNTSEDDMTTPSQTLLLADALSRMKIPYEVHTFECGPHGLSTANAGSAVMSGQVRPDVEVWQYLVKTWLNKRFAVNLPDKMPY